MRRVLIDTDPGIDDAIAILFALHAGGLRVEGITTVAGNIGLELTTRNALRILALGGHGVPVVAGSAQPLSRAGVQELAIHGEDGLGGVTLPGPLAAPVESDAVAWLASKLMAQEAGSHDLLALGPLTNVARLVREAPEAARRIGRLVAMGGAIEVRGNVGPHAEFNIANDPEAAEIVLAAGLDLTLVPLDVTRQVRADAAFLSRLSRAGTPQARAVRDLVAAYFDRASDAARPESRPLHDPCVPVLALAPHLFDLRPMRLSVICGEPPEAGRLVAGEHEVKVALGVRAEAVLDLLAGTLG